MKLNACAEIWGESSNQLYDVESDEMNQKDNESLEEFRYRVHKKIDAIFDDIENHESKRRGGLNEN